MGLNFKFDVVVPMDISCPYTSEGLNMKDQGLEVQLALQRRA